MEEFTEEYSRTLQTREWLVKVDNANSVPYLFKFGISDDENTCYILLTDMKTVWTEVLRRSQILRRWRQCNQSLPLVNSDEPFSRLRSLVRDLHTPGGIQDANFDIVETRDADLAFELDCDSFKWRWDTYLSGPKTSADIISKQLIQPLISLAHVSFYSADPVSELEEGDLEKTVDKICRTARRSVDIHVKQTLARPRIATTLQRISSLFGLFPSLPPIKSELEMPELEGHLTALRAHVVTLSDDVSGSASTGTSDNRPREDATSANLPRSSEPITPSAERKSFQPPITDDAVDGDSATQSDSDDEQDALAPKAKPSISRASSSNAHTATSMNHPTISHHASRVETSDSDSPPAKKVRNTPKPASDSESDSDSATKRRSQGSQGTSSGTRTLVGRGVRQPLKRGGKRF